MLLEGCKPYSLYPGSERISGSLSFRSRPLLDPTTAQWKPWPWDQHSGGPDPGAKGEQTLPSIRKSGPNPVVRREGRKHKGT